MACPAPASFGQRAMLSCRSNELLGGRLRLLHRLIYKRGIVSIQSDQGDLPTENNDDHPWRRRNNENDALFQRRRRNSWTKE